MLQPMTRWTEPHDIQMILRTISSVVMAFWLANEATLLTASCSQQDSVTESVLHGIVSSNSVGILTPKYGNVFSRLCSYALRVLPFPFGVPLKNSRAVFCSVLGVVCLHCLGVFTVPFLNNETCFFRVSIVHRLIILPYGAV